MHPQSKRRLTYVVAGTDATPDVIVREEQGTFYATVVIHDVGTTLHITKLCEDADEAQDDAERMIRAHYEGAEIRVRDTG